MPRATRTSIATAAAGVQPWEYGPLAPVLAPGAAHVWLCELDQAPRSGTTATLAPGELERADRVGDGRTRRRWMAARATLRMLLGAYLSLGPREVLLEAGPNGKPRLAGAPSGGGSGRALAQIEFNVSHSGALALLAFARSTPVGVDLELLRGREVSAALARRALGAEPAERLAQLPAGERERAFLREWARLEAAVKCEGGTVWSLVRSHAPRLKDAVWVRELELGSHAAGALALAREPQELCCWRVPGGG